MLGKVELKQPLTTMRRETIEYEIELFNFSFFCSQTREINRKICAKHRILFPSGTSMTPKEELYKKLFLGFKIKVKDLTELEMRARREELIEIIEHSKCEIYTIDDEMKERLPKKPSQGFQRNLNVDDVTSDAINTIKKRQGKIDKFDKIRENLIKMGMSDDAADKVMSARNISSQVNKVQNTTPVAATTKFESTPEQTEVVNKVKDKKIIDEEKRKEELRARKLNLKQANPFENMK